MKLLHVIASMDPRTGGPCQAVRNLGPQNDNRNYTMEVVCLDDPGSGYLAHDNLLIHALGRGRGPWYYHPALRPWLDENLFRYDAVILNGLWLYCGYALYRAAQRDNAPPYFVYPHGMLDPWFQRAPGRRLKAIRNWFHWKVAEQSVVRNARAVLFTCAEEMRLARNTFHPYEPKLEVNVGFGIVEPPEYHRGMEAAFAAKCPGLNGRPYFLFLGRVDPKKGVDLLVKAYAATFPHSSAQPHSSSIPALVVAGPGLETEYGRQMQALAAEICPPGSVLWPGMLTGDAKWGALNHAEAFVLSSHQENFGIAVVEALACGKPVLISDQVNIWREIKDDRAGLTEADTVEGTERLFRQWKRLSPDDKTFMSRAAKSTYERRFSIALTAQNLINTVTGLTRSI